MQKIHNERLAKKIVKEYLSRQREKLYDENTNPHDANVLKILASEELDKQKENRRYFSLYASKDRLRRMGNQSILFVAGFLGGLIYNTSQDNMDLGGIIHTVMCGIFAPSLYSVVFKSNEQKVKRAQENISLLERAVY